MYRILFAASTFGHTPARLESTMEMLLVMYPCVHFNVIVLNGMWRGWEEWMKHEETHGDGEEVRECRSWGAGVCRTITPFPIYENLIPQSAPTCICVYWTWTYTICITHIRICMGGGGIWKIFVQVTFNPTNYCNVIRNECWDYAKIP